MCTRLYDAGTMLTCSHTLTLTHTHKWKCHAVKRIYCTRSVPYSQRNKKMANEKQNVTKVIRKEVIKTQNKTNICTCLTLNICMHASKRIDMLSGIWIPKCKSQSITSLSRRALTTPTNNWRYERFSVALIGLVLCMRAYVYLWWLFAVRLVPISYF